MSDAPVLTIDGPSGSGKGTVSQRIAKKLGWHYLDSGALYRALGLLVFRSGVDFNEEEQVAAMAGNMDLEFKEGKIWLSGEVADDQIRTEEAGNRASKVAAIPAVREALLQWQRSCARPPGLVADGRDMGTVVFPRADCKIYLTASADARAQRRFKQLRDKGFDVNIRLLLREIAERDERDAGRTVSPLKPAEDAIFLDTTDLDVDQVVYAVIEALNNRIGNV